MTNRALWWGHWWGQVLTGCCPNTFNTLVGSGLAGLLPE